MALRFAVCGFDAVAVFVAVFSFPHFHRNRNRNRKLQRKNRKPQTAHRSMVYTNYNVVRNKTRIGLQPFEVDILLAKNY